MSQAETPPGDAVRPAPRRRRRLLTAVVVLVSAALALLLGEVVARIWTGKGFASVRLAPDTANDVAIAEYDAALGWVPRPGVWNGPMGACSVGKDRIRSNGGAPPPAGRPLLVVGDSMTFGEEVADDETWPARLEARLSRRVLNGGVFAYGTDQAVLRAEALVAQHHPETVAVALIGDDLTRAECSYYHGWKPYFDLDGDGLAARNVPVPRGAAASGPDAGLRSVLGRSVLAHAIFSRASPGWWYAGRSTRVHDDGDVVTVRLLRRLGERVRESGGALRVVALGSSGKIGSDERLPRFVEEARAAGLEVLDVAGALASHFETDEAARASFFRPRGHYSPAGNAWVADWLAERLAR